MCHVSVCVCVFVRLCVFCTQYNSLSNRDKLFYTLTNTSTSTFIRSKFLVAIFFFLSFYFTDGKKRRLNVLNTTSKEFWKLLKFSQKHNFTKNGCFLNEKKDCYTCKLTNDFIFGNDCKKTYDSQSNLSRVFENHNHTMYNCDDFIYRIQIFSP